MLLDIKRLFNKMCKSAIFFNENKIKIKANNFTVNDPKHITKLFDFKV